MHKVLQIALNTYRETIRSKTLYSVFFFAVLLVLVTSLFGSVTIGEQSKVVKDFGLMSVAFFSLALAVLSGAALLSKELNRKTIYNILAKPVWRWQFLLGKHLGLMFSVGLMVALMAGALVLYAALFDGEMDFLILISCAYIFLEMMIMVAAAIFFSSIVVTPVLSGLFTFSLFMAGRSSEYMLSWVEKASGALAKQILLGIYWVLPHLGALNVSNDAVYGVVPGIDYFLLSLGYSLGYSGVLLILANLFFMRREFN